MSIDQKSLQDLYLLWDQLGDIPIEDREGDASLDEPFLHFPKGTEVESVWHWFEEKNSQFIVGDVMQGIRVEEVLTPENLGHSLISDGSLQDEICKQSPDQALVADDPEEPDRPGP